MNLKEYFSRKNESLYVITLNDESMFDLDSFKEYINNFEKLIVEYQNNKSEYKDTMRYAIDILIYTLSSFNYHHSKEDVFIIKNYNDYTKDDFVDDELLDVYVINTIRKIISKVF